MTARVRGVIAVADGGRIDDEGVGVDVDEHGTCAAQLDGVRRRRERVRGDDDLVAGPDLEREQREVEGGRARRNRRRMRGAHGARDSGLELLDLRAHRQLAGADDLLDRCELLVPDVGPGEPNRLGHDAFARYQAMVRSRPSSSSTFASNPSRSRALSTFGIRSSTSV